MKRIQLQLLLAFFLGASLLTVPFRPAWAAMLGPFLQNELTTSSPTDKIPVIIRMQDSQPPPNLAVPPRAQGPARAQARAEMIMAFRDRAARSRAPLQQWLDRQGIANFRQLWLINGLAFQATVAEIREMANLPGVASIVFDRTIELPAEVTVQASAAVEPNIDLVQAPALWNLGYAGQGITVAIVDTGVDINHPDLGPQWRGGTNSWFDPNGDYPSVPVDHDGHGTQVTGLILGGNHSGAYIGVAPEAQWIGVKIFADDGTSTNSAIHAGFQWLLDPDGNPATDDAPDIVNSSWGFEDSPGLCSALTTEFRSDVQALKAANIAVVFPAGNTGPAENTSISPGNYPESFAVGAVGTSSSTTEISSFSAHGPSACDGTIFPEVVAPGFQLLTSDMTDDGIHLNAYSLVAGTSFSTAHASGVMALLLGALPWTPVGGLETALKTSASDLGPAGADNTYGYGLIDALAAYNYLVGRPAIDVTDSISPETDHLLPFGSVTPGESVLATVQVRNTGSVPLSLGAVDMSDLHEPFSLTSDRCSSRLLAAGQSCTIDLKFAPTSQTSFSASLVILSNAVDEERVTVTMTGTGNTPPIAPQPLSPADGATVGGTVTFTWRPASDADGDAVSQFLVYSPHADFSYATTRQVDSIPAVLLASGAFLLAGLVALVACRRRDLTIGLVLAGLMLAIAACGSGGGSSAATTDSQSTTISGLVQGASYYWKMVARDSHGAEAESAVRTIHVE